MTEGEWLTAAVPENNRAFFLAKANARQRRRYSYWRAEQLCRQRGYLTVDLPGGAAGTQEAALAFLVSTLVDAKLIEPHAADELVRKILRRAHMGPSVYEGITVPHARSDWVQSAIGVLADCSVPVLWNDDFFSEVEIILLSLGPTSARGDHLRALEEAARVIRGPSLTEENEKEHNGHVQVMRDILANPFRPVAFDPTWRTAAVLTLAETVYGDRSFDRLPILADALEDAGCDNRDVLDHCRQPGGHVRGCWVVDLVLGKE